MRPGRTERKIPRRARLSETSRSSPPAPHSRTRPGGVGLSAVWKGRCDVGQRDGTTTRGRKITSRTCGRTVRNGPRKGQVCGQPAKRGTVPPACRHHLGGPRKHAEAAVRVELESWLPGDGPYADPGEVLLALVTQSATRVRKYATLLAHAEAAAARVQALLEHDRLLIADEGAVPGETRDDGRESPALQAARADLHHVFTTGGVSAIIGHTYSSTQTGGIYATGEAVRALVIIEAQERDRAARFAKLALDAGIAERQVRIAERQGAILEQVLIGVLDELGLTDAQLDTVPDRIERHLALLTG